MNSELLEKHLDLVMEANKITNITRIVSRESAMTLHIEDSLAALPEFEAAPQGLYADLGSGAGFPGIPIAIETGRDTILVESVKKKAALLDTFIHELKLENVTVFPGRAEELALQKRNTCSVLSARALSKLGSLLELGSPLLKKGGHFICYKAHIDDEELNHACSLEEKIGLRLISDRSFLLSDEETFRRILVFEKFKNASLKLPRRNGMAQKNPL